MFQVMKLILIVVSKGRVQLILFQIAYQRITDGKYFLKIYCKHYNYSLLGQSSLIMLNPLAIVQTLLHDIN